MVRLNITDNTYKCRTAPGAPGTLSSLGSLQSLDVGNTAGGGLSHYFTVGGGVALHFTAG